MFLSILLILTHLILITITILHHYNGHSTDEETEVEVK